MAQTEDNETGKVATLTPTEETPSQITFLYNKSNYYREIYASGAFGGLTQGFDLHMSFYNQHKVPFEKQIFEVGPDGTLGKELQREPSGLGPVLSREIEVGVTLDISTAIALMKWLERQITDAQKVVGIDPSSEMEQQ
jgi:hypothetical protein